MFKLEAVSISKSYGNRRIFSELSFSTSVSVFGIEGPNGSGKSTLIRCLTGLLRTNHGKILWQKDGNPIDKAQLYQYLGFSAPYIQLYESLSCAENLRFPAELRHQNDIETTIELLLDKFEMTEFRDQLFGELSTGQQQRMKLAAACIHKPGILCLDEPGSNLDEKGKNMIAELADEYRKAGNMVILASNQKDELDLCDQTIRL